VLEGFETGPIERVAFERHSPLPESAHRISAGDSVKLVVLRRPNDTYNASMFLEIWDPGGSQPANSHPDSVETFYFLSGLGTAYSDGDETEVRANDLIVLPPGTLHRIENTGVDKLYAITTMVPDGGFAELVEAGPAATHDDDDDDLVVLYEGRVRQG
jgi:mannose-6-phosphate isomerase-like protein (cupin superfamily)